MRAIATTELMERFEVSLSLTHTLSLSDTHSYTLSLSDTHSHTLSLSDTHSHTLSLSDTHSLAFPRTFGDALQWYMPFYFFQLLVGPCWRDVSPFGSLRSPQRALLTERKVESGTSQSKSGTSDNPVTVKTWNPEPRTRDTKPQTRNPGCSGTRCSGTCTTPESKKGLPRSSFFSRFSKWISYHGALLNEFTPTLWRGRMFGDALQWYMPFYFFQMGS